MSTERPRGREAVGQVRVAMIAKLRATDALLQLSCNVTRAQYREGVAMGWRDYHREQDKRDAEPTTRSTEETP